MSCVGNTKLYRIGELARLAGVSPRTIDYYTRLGLIQPEQRSTSNYRYYSQEALIRLQRIVEMKQGKFTLDEIKRCFDRVDQIRDSEMVAERLTALQVHLKQLEQEAKELRPMIEKLKPGQVRNLMKSLTPQSVACIEALLMLLGKEPPVF